MVKINNFLVDIEVNTAAFRDVNAAAPPASTTIGVPALCGPGPACSILRRSRCCRRRLPASRARRSPVKKSKGKKKKRWQACGSPAFPTSSFRSRRPPQRLYRLLADDGERGRPPHRCRARRHGRRLWLQFQARYAPQGRRERLSRDFQAGGDRRRARHADLGEMLGRDEEREAGGTASARSPSACSIWRCGTRGESQKACRCGGCLPTATTTARPPTTPPGAHAAVAYHYPDTRR